VKKKILILLILLFPQIVFSEMRQKTQGNTNNLPINNADIPPTPSAGPTPDSGPLTNVYPQWAYFNFTTNGTQEGQTLAENKCQTLGSGWRLPTLAETRPLNVIAAFIDSNIPPTSSPGYNSFFYVSTGLVQKGSTVPSYLFSFFNAQIPKVICYHS
jgi:hypothetical protein